MTVFPRGLVAACVLLAAAGGYAQEHAHEHATPGLEQLTLDHGKPWATDAPLREAMERIRSGVRQSHPRRGLTPAQFAALAGRVRAEVNYMIANCKLPPAADANLHLVIAHLLRGAEQMENAADAAAREQGVATVQEALRAYGTHFMHPGWHQPKR